MSSAGGGGGGSGSGGSGSGCSGSGSCSSDIDDNSSSDTASDSDSEDVPSELQEQHEEQEQDDAGEDRLMGTAVVLTRAHASLLGDRKAVAAVGVDRTVMVSGMLIVVFLYLGNGNVFTVFRTLMKPCIANDFIKGAIEGTLGASGLRKIVNDARKEARLAGDFKNLPLDCAAAEKLLNGTGGPVYRSSQHAPVQARSDPSTDSPLKSMAMSTT